jgi:hypothetical protein
MKDLRCKIGVHDYRFPLKGDIVVVNMSKTVYHPKAYVPQKCSKCGKEMWKTFDNETFDCKVLSLEEGLKFFTDLRDKGGMLSER